MLRILQLLFANVQNVFEFFLLKMLKLQLAKPQVDR